MDQIVTTVASPTKGQPIVANAGDGSIPFLQRGVMESMWNILVGILGGYTTNDVIIIEGFEVTLSNSNNTATWTAGRVGYNGEIYTVQAGTLTKTGGQTFLYSISITNHPSLDPVLFSDNTANNVHNIRQVTITKGTSGTGIADLGGATVKLKTQQKIIPIGDWNMDTDVTKVVAHGIGSFFTKIKKISAVIIDDASSGISPLDLIDNTASVSLAVLMGGVVNIGSSDIDLYRTPGGVFDSAGFDSTGFNRGFITIEYGDI